MLAVPEMCSHTAMATGALHTKVAAVIYTAPLAPPTVHIHVDLLFTIDARL